MEENDLQDNLKFFGAQDEESLPLLISRGRIGIVPPHKHVTGLFGREYSINALEYMACKVPMVGPNSPFMEEITEKGKLAFLYDPNSPESLAALILTSLNNQNTTYEKSSMAYNHIRKHFSATSMRRRIVKAYARMLTTTEQSGEEVFEGGGVFKSSTITWQGQQTSSTGAGSNKPNVGLSPLKPDSVITLQIDDIEFEASGSLLGASYDDHDPNLHEEKTDPIIPIE